MIATVQRTARLLAAHWPALVAWFLAGTLGHYLVLKLAALVGARSALGGILLLPVAALMLLIAYVAMLLVLRDGMPKLRSVAPLPDGRAERRTAFLDGVLGGILPFMAFYAAWGFLREDVVDYINGAFVWQFAWGLEAVVNGVEYDTSGTIDDLGVNAGTVVILVAAFLARWAYQRYRARLPKAVGVVAVYLEGLWVYLAAYVLADLLGSLSGWVQSRQAMVWLGELRAGLVGTLAPLGFLWDGVEWLLGEAGGLILLPVAWLTIAGVVYGQAVKADAPRLSGDVVERMRTRYATVPQRVRRRLGDFWGQLTGRFRPIGRALTIMWRAGPVLIAGYVLLFTVVTLGEQWLTIGLSRLIGPHELMSFWVPASVALTMVVALVVEPVRMAVVASTYDHTLGRLMSSADVEAHVDETVGSAEGELDDEGSAGVSGEQDGVGEVVGDGRL